MVETELKNNTDVDLYDDFVNNVMKQIDNCKVSSTNIPYYYTITGTNNNGKLSITFDTRDETDARAG